MLIAPGKWMGKGSVLLQGMSIGQTVNVDIDVTEQADGLTVTGQVSVGEESAQDLSVRIVPNEVGTYTLDAFLAGTRLDGVGKLESEPHVGLLWHERELAHASVALFALSRGFGCRGFLREKETVRTWEIAFALKQVAVGGDNVVSLAKRRRR